MFGLHNGHLKHAAAADDDYDNDSCIGPLSAYSKSEIVYTGVVSDYLFTL